MKQLTARQLHILQRLNSGEELTYSKGGGWWVGLEQVSGKTVFALLRGCALHLGYDESGYQIYSINETGKKALETGQIMEYTDILALANK